MLKLKSSIITCFFGAKNLNPPTNEFSFSDKKTKLMKNTSRFVLLHYALTIFALSSHIFVLQDITDYQGRYENISYTLGMSEEDILAMDEKFFAIKYPNKTRDQYYFLDKDDSTLIPHISSSPDKDVYVVFEHPTKTGKSFGCVISLNPDPKIRIQSDSLSQIVKTNLSLERLCVKKINDYIRSSDT